MLNKADVDHLPDVETTLGSHTLHYSALGYMWPIKFDHFGLKPKFMEWPYWSKYLTTISVRQIDHNLDHRGHIAWDGVSDIYCSRPLIAGLNSSFQSETYPHAIELHRRYSGITILKGVAKDTL